MARKPSSLPRTLKFNQVVGVDLVEFNDLGLELTMTNMVCWGTGYQMMAIIPDKRSISARDIFSKEWVRHYGWPELVVTDQGPEFTGKEFSHYLGEAGCLITHTDVQQEHLRSLKSLLS